MSLPITIVKEFYAYKEVFQRSKQSFNEVQKKMGLVSRLLLVGHALLGCDTTSRVFGLGKQAVLPLLKKSEVFRKKCKVFLDESSSKDEIVKAG